MELLGFLTVILNMGLIHVPEIEDYWKTCWTSEIGFSCLEISSNKYFGCFLSAIQVFLHSKKKINKVKTFLDYLISKFQSSYYPSRNIAVDETMVWFRGHFSAKQYMQKKPEKWGIKAYTMADSTNGYMLVYTGAETLDQSTTDQALPQPARIVMHLVETYLDLGHHIGTIQVYHYISSRTTHLIYWDMYEKPSGSTR